MGEEVTVGGLAAGYQVITGRWGRPILLLFDIGVGNQAGSPASSRIITDTFAALSWRVDNQNRQNNPGLFYSGKTLCVTGSLEIWDDRPLMIITDQSQVQVGC